ncbi:MAG: sugar phosphate nucleotidyltransferase [Aggregatilineales bacterium]
MKVVIPLAGFGTRLRPFTFTKPKPLINVAGKPVLGHLLDKIASLPIEEYIFIIGHLGEQVEDYVRSNYSIPARFVEQTEMLGQSHAIWLARDWIDDSPVFVVFVDTLFEADLDVLQTTDADAVIYVKEVPDPRSFGVVTLDAQRYITSFVEKPKSMDNRLAVIGLYYFKNGRTLINAIQQTMDRKTVTKGEYYLADAMDIMVKAGLKFRTSAASVWLDCGKPDTVLETNRYLLEHGHDNAAEFRATDSIIVPPVHIDPSATISRSVIGPHVTVAANCEVTGSIISDSILDEGAAVKSALLEHSLVGRNARVEDRANTVNVGDSSAVGYV